MDLQADDPMDSVEWRHVACAEASILRVLCINLLPPGCMLPRLISRSLD